MDMDEVIPDYYKEDLVDGNSWHLNNEKELLSVSDLQKPPIKPFMRVITLFLCFSLFLSNIAWAKTGNFNTFILSHSHLKRIFPTQRLIEEISKLPFDSEDIEEMKDKPELLYKVCQELAIRYYDKEMANRKNPLKALFEEFLDIIIPSVRADDFKEWWQEDNENMAVTAITKDSQTQKSEEENEFDISFIKKIVDSKIENYELIVTDMVSASAAIPASTKIPDNCGDNPLLCVLPQSAVRGKKEDMETESESLDSTTDTVDDTDTNEQVQGLLKEQEEIGVSRYKEVIAEAEEVIRAKSAVTMPRGSSDTSKVEELFYALITNLGKGIPENNNAAINNNSELTSRIIYLYNNIMPSNAPPAKPSLDENDRVNDTVANAFLSKISSYFPEADIIDDAVPVLNKSTPSSSSSSSDTPNLIVNPPVVTPNSDNSSTITQTEQTSLYQLLEDGPQEVTFTIRALDNCASTDLALYQNGKKVCEWQLVRLGENIFSVTLTLSKDDTLEIVLMNNPGVWGGCAIDYVEIQIAGQTFRFDTDDGLDDIHFSDVYSSRAVNAQESRDSAIAMINPDWEDFFKSQREELGGTYYLSYKEGPDKLDITGLLFYHKETSSTINVLETKDTPVQPPFDITPLFQNSNDPVESDQPTATPEPAAPDSDNPIPANSTPIFFNDTSDRTYLIEQTEQGINFSPYQGNWEMTLASGTIITVTFEEGKPIKAVDKQGYEYVAVQTPQGLSFSPLNMGDLLTAEPKPVTFTIEARGKGENGVAEFVLMVNDQIVGQWKPDSTAWNVYAITVNIKAGDKIELKQINTPQASAEIFIDDITIEIDGRKTKFDVGNIPSSENNYGQDGNMLNLSPIGKIPVKWSTIDKDNASPNLTTEGIHTKLDNGGEQIEIHVYGTDSTGIPPCNVVTPELINVYKNSPELQEKFPYLFLTNGKNLSLLELDDNHPIVEWAQTEGYKIYPELAAYGPRPLTVDYTFTIIRTPTENGYIETITDSQGNTSTKTVIKNEDGSITIITKGQYVDKNDPESGRGMGDQSWNPDYVFYPDKVTIEKRWDLVINEYGQLISYQYQNSDDCNAIITDDIDGKDPAALTAEEIANLCLKNAPVKQWYGATYNPVGLINAYNISWQFNGSHNISVYDIDYNLLGFKISDIQSYWYYYYEDGKHGSSYTVTYQKDTQTTYEWNSLGQISHINQDVLLENYDEDIDEPNGFFNSTVGQICLIVVSAVLIAYTGGAAAGALAGVLGSSGLLGLTATCLGYFAAGTIVSTIRNLMLGYSFDEALQMGLETGAISGLTAGVFQGLESTQILSDIGKGINWLIDKIPGLDSITNTISSGWNFLTDNILSDAINWLGKNIGYHSGNSLWNMFIDKTVDTLLAYYGMEAAGGETWGAFLAGLVSGGLDPDRTALTGTLGWGSQAAASQELEGSQWQNPLAAIAGMLGEGLGTALSGGAENLPEALAAAFQGSEGAVISGLVSAAIIGELGDEFGIDDACRQEASLLFDIISSDNQFKQGVKIIADAGLSVLIQTIDPDMDPLTSGLIQIGISALIADLAMDNRGFIDILKKNIRDILTANGNANTASYMAYLDSVMDLAKSIIELGFDEAIEQYVANGLHQAAADNIAMAINYIRELRKWRNDPVVIANAQALGLDINDLTPEQFDRALAEWRNNPENIANAQALGLDINSLTPVTLNNAIEEWKKDPTVIANANLLNLDINTITPVTLNQAIAEWKKDPTVIANADLLGLDIDTITPVTLNQAINEWKSNPITISNAEELGLDITTLTPEQYNQALTEWRENPVTIIQAGDFGLDITTLTPLTLNEALGTLSKFADILGLDIYCLTPEEFEQVLGKWRNSTATIGNADALELNSSTVTPGQLNQAIAEWKNTLDETTITTAQILGLDINTLTPHLLNEWKKLLTNLGLDINDSNFADTLNEQLGFCVNTTLQNTYVVEEGDYSLRAIANEIYGNPDMWKAIAQINRLNIGETDTDYIFTSAGKELILPKQIFTIGNTPVFIFSSEAWAALTKNRTGDCKGGTAYYYPAYKAIFISEESTICSALSHELVHAKQDVSGDDALDTAYGDLRKEFLEPIISLEDYSLEDYLLLDSQLDACIQAICGLYESCYGERPPDDKIKDELFAIIYTLSDNPSDPYIQAVYTSFTTNCDESSQKWYCSLLPFVNTLLQYPNIKEFLAQYYQSLGLPVPAYFNTNVNQILNLPVGDLTGVLPQNLPLAPLTTF